MPEVTLPWGDGEMKVALPEHWTLQQVARAELPPAPSDWPDRLAEALDQPTGEGPLSQLLAARRSGRIVLVVEDMTRHSPLPAILDVIMREIRHARIENDQLEVFFATGMHPPMTDRQAAEKLGPLTQSVRWRSNEYDRREQYVSVGGAGAGKVMIDRGVVEADLRIIVSSVSPHLQAGFGGGYKMFLPGCAYIESIRQLHRQALGRKARQLIGTDSAGNEMRSMIDRFGRLIDDRGGKTFAVQYVLDESDNPTFIAAGEVMATQQMLAKRCSVAAGVMVDRSADVLLVNAYPRDFDLWQSFKGIANTRLACRKNGVIICLSRCPAGTVGMKLPRWTISGAWVRRIVRLLGSEVLASLMTRFLPSLAGDAAFFVRMALRTIHRNTVIMVSPALAALEKPFPGLTVFADFRQAIAATEQILGAGPQRVIVFPSGGTTFPIFSQGQLNKTEGEGG